VNAALLFGALFGLGALSLLTAQRHGAAKPSLAHRLDQLRPDIPSESTKPRVRVFRTEVFEQLLRPHIERAGELGSAVLRRLGLNLSETEDRLRITGDRGGLPLFIGQKIASGIIGFAFLPAAASMRAAPRTPLFLWLALGTAGFVMPDLVLRSRAQTARRAMRDELVRFTEMLTLAVSSGPGLEGAIDQVVSSADGRLFAEVRRLLREGGLRAESAATSLSRLAGDLGLPEAEPLATALRTATAQGTPVIQALRAQAHAVRERRRLELIEAGERAQIRMLLPVGLLILPAFFVVVLYPAAVQLLRVTAR
jgi:tight adherence protein C